jgi:hypothetical protein
VVFSNCDAFGIVCLVNGADAAHITGTARGRIAVRRSTRLCGALA